MGLSGVQLPLVHHLISVFGWTDLSKTRMICIEMLELGAKE